MAKLDITHIKSGTFQNHSNTKISIPMPWYVHCATLYNNNV